MKVPAAVLRIAKANGYIAYRHDGGRCEGCIGLLKATDAAYKQGLALGLARAKKKGK